MRNLYKLILFAVIIDDRFTNMTIKLSTIDLKGFFCLCYPVFS